VRLALRVRGLPRAFIIVVIIIKARTCPRLYPVRVYSAHTHTHTHTHAHLTGCRRVVLSFKRQIDAEMKTKTTRAGEVAGGEKVTRLSIYAYIIYIYILFAFWIYSRRITTQFTFAREKKIRKYIIYVFVLRDVRQMEDRKSGGCARGAKKQLPLVIKMSVSIRKFDSACVCVYYIQYTWYTCLYYITWVYHECVWSER